MATVTYFNIMKKNLLLILFCSLNLLCFAQLNDIRVNFSPLILYNKTTQLDYKDSLDTHNTRKTTIYGLDISYCRIFKNDYYAKIRYGIEYYNDIDPSKIASASSLYEYNNTYKYLNHKIEIEGGRKLTFKFIDFLIGGGLYYKICPPTTQTFNRDEYSLTDNSYMGTQTYIFENPYSHYIGIYLNTSLYLKLYKVLYFGIEINNGLTYGMMKGESKTTWNLYDSNHLLEKQEIHEDNENIKQFAHELFNLNFGLRVVFPDMKKKDKK